MSVLAATVAALLVTLALAVATAGVLLAAAARADAAADAAALAAAPATFPPLGRPSPVTEAARLAAANGAHLRACRCPVVAAWRPRAVEVEVEVVVSVPPFGRITVPGRARAEFDPVAWIGS